MSTEWFISYKVPFVSGDKEHIKGPYGSVGDAEFDAHDIAGYVGVTDLHIYKENADQLLTEKLEH